MIKVGDCVKIVSVHKRDAYSDDGLSGSRGVVQSVDGVNNIKGINYYAGCVRITDPSEGCKKYDTRTPFYFACVQLRKVKK